MSSEAVIKCVSKKLKYYFDVKRLEDGFDLSTSDCPKLDHPPLRPRSTLQYDGLHDRPLKHYFGPKDIKVALTQMKSPPEKKSREKVVKKKLGKQMQKHQYAPSVLHDAFYLQNKKKSKKLRPELTGFGVPLRKRKMPHRGGYPVLRTVPSSTISAAEANRLVNMATKLLVATELVDLGHGRSRRVPKSKSARSGAPKPFESSSSLPNVNGDDKKHSNNKTAQSPRYYTYNLDGQKVEVLYSSDVDDTSDSAYQSPTPRGMYVTIDDKHADDDTVPPWLKSEMRSRGISDDDNSQFVRPVSAMSNGSQPRPPSTPKNNSRPSSAGSGRRKIKGTDLVNNNTDSSSVESMDRSRVTSTEDLSTQTGGELLKHYNAMDKIIEHGDRTRYRIHVHTGDRIGASTKAPIRIVLVGDRGRSKEIALKNSTTHKVKFQRGQEDIFDINSYYVGPLRRIGIGHDKTELGTGWFLDKVLIKDISYHKQYVITANKWLSSKDPDALTFRELEVKSTMDYEDESTSDNDSVRATPKEPISYEKASSSSTARDSDSHSETSMQENMGSDDEQARIRTPSTSSSDNSDTESEYSESNTEGSNSVADKSHFAELKNDNFFDKSGPGADYSSVIESLSTTTSVDNKNDFPDKEVAVRGPLSRRPTLLPILTDTESEPDIDGSSTGRLSEDGMPSRRTSVVLRLEKPVDEDIENGPTIHEACKAGDLERVKKLLNYKSAWKDSPNAMGWRPLHIAASEGHTNVVNWLMTYGVGLDIRTPTGFNPIHLATMNGHIGVMAVLLAMGADIGALNVEHQTPLFIAASSGNIECVKWLIFNEVDPTVPDNMGKLPEDIAQEKNHLEVYRYLKKIHTENESDDSDSKDDEEEETSDESSEDEDATQNNDSDADTATERTATPDEELLEKRRLYDEQHDKMKSNNMSFLDSLRAEVEQS